jgi:hypothetical protein
VDGRTDWRDGANSIFLGKCAKKRDVRYSSTRQERIERYFYFFPPFGQGGERIELFRTFPAFARSPF